MQIPLDLSHHGGSILFHANDQLRIDVGDISVHGDDPVLHAISAIEAGCSEMIVDGEVSDQFLHDRRERVL